MTIKNKGKVELGLPCKVTPTWAEFSRSTNFDQWANIGKELVKRTEQFRDSFNFWIGDWLNAGEQKFGEMYTQAVNDLGIALDRARQLKFVSARIPREWRYPPDRLSWSHHRIVAAAHGLDEIQRQAWLKAAAKHQISTRELEEQIAKESGTEKKRGRKSRARQAAEIVSDGTGLPVDEQSIRRAEEYTEAPAPCGVCHENPGVQVVCSGCLALVQIEKTKGDQNNGGEEKQ